jgi:tetratricopeptide (TPR) repeat protein
MKGCIRVLALLVLALAAGRIPADATVEFATLRGKVFDADRKPLADVQIAFEFKGESRVKIMKNAATDKKGGFVRAGLPGGEYRITFTKEGYQPFIMEMALSIAGFTEAKDVVMVVAKSDAAGGPLPPNTEAVLPADVSSTPIKVAYEKASAASKEGRLDDAIAGYNEVIQLAPQLAAAHYNLAFVYQTQKKWKEAEAEFVKVTELQPTRSDAFIALSAVRELDGRSQEAVEGLLKAAPAFEQDANFQFALGVTCIDLGRSADALPALKKVVALDPANVEVHYHLGSLAIGANDVPGALAELQKYVSLQGQDPGNLETAKSLITALSKKK